jgi:hypothetical protein
MYTHTHTHENACKHVTEQSSKKKGTEGSFQDGEKNMKLKESVKNGGRGEFKESLCSKELVVGLHR